MNPATDLRWKRAVLPILFGWGWTLAAWAHDPGLSTATVRISMERVESLITFALQDADEMGGLDTNRDGQVAMEEFSARRERLGQLVASAFEVRFDGDAVQATNILCQLDDNNNVEVYLIVPGRKFSTLTIRSKMIAGFRLDHRQYLVLQNPGGDALAERLLSANSDTVTIQVDPEPATPPALLYPEPPKPARNDTRSFAQFLILGIKSLVMGYDHLLFLFALLIATRGVFSSLKSIVAFSIAHSITLAVATFHLVQIPEKIIGPLIAATIVYIGVENVMRRGDPPGRVSLAFAFGLIHGFGLASTLRQSGVHAPAGGAAMPLFAFNLGIELGQIGFVAVLLLLFGRMRQKPLFVNQVVPASSVAAALVGGWWLAQRVWPG